MVQAGDSLHADQPSLLSRTWKRWEKIGSVLAILGLADLFGQVVKWAAGIHWVVSKYVAARSWVFSWAPFHIPPEWQHSIVLFLLVFSVTSIGFYQRTGKYYGRAVYDHLRSSFTDEDPLQKARHAELDKLYEREGWFIARIVVPLLARVVMICVVTWGITWLARFLLTLPTGVNEWLSYWHQVLMYVGVGTGFLVTGAPCGMALDI